MLDTRQSSFQFFAAVWMATMLLFQAPMVYIKSEEGGTVAAVSPLQVVMLSRFTRDASGVSNIYKAALMPGAVFKDVSMLLHCSLMGHEAACRAPRYSDWDALLTEARPLYYPKYVLGSLARTYGKATTKILLGCTLFLITGFMALLAASKLPVLGAGLIAWTVLQSGHQLPPLAWMQIGLAVASSGLLGKGASLGRDGMRRNAENVEKLDPLII